MVYECPKCGREGVEEDGRAGAFMCRYEGCNFSLKFSQYSPHAALLTGKSPERDSKRLPSMDYPLSELRASNLLKFLYKDLELSRSKLGKG